MRMGVHGGVGGGCVGMHGGLCGGGGESRGRVGGWVGRRLLLGSVPRRWGCSKGACSVVLRAVLLQVSGIQLLLLRSRGGISMSGWVTWGGSRKGRGCRILLLLLLLWLTVRCGSHLLRHAVHLCELLNVHVLITIAIV